MRFERLVAMNVTDPARYERYRAAMSAILKGFGGGFAYDVSVTAAQCDASHPVTRIFAIYFRDEAASQAFFTNDEYAKVRAEHFDEAVDGFTELANYSVESPLPSGD